MRHLKRYTEDMLKPVWTLDTDRQESVGVSVRERVGRLLNEACFARQTSSIIRSFFI